MTKTYDHVGDFSKLLNLLVVAVEAQAGAKIPKGMAWINDRQVLAKMLVFNLATVQTLARGSTLSVGSQSVPYVDHGSMKVLTRAALENYLVFAHIFGPEDQVVSKFRHDVWKYCGLMDRQSLAPTTDQSREAQRVEAVDLQKMRSELEAHELMLAMPRGARKSILEQGQWKAARPWRVLAREADLNEVYFNNIYGYLCGYSHASYAAALQVGQANTLEEQNHIALSMLGIGNVVMAKMLALYSKLFETATSALNRSEHRGLIDLWGFTAKDFAAIYESVPRPASEEQDGERR